MPSPFTSQRQSQRRNVKSMPPKAKSNDLDTPLGPYDLNSVRDRVRQWQSAGGGVITADDVFVEVEDHVSAFKGRATEQEWRQDENDTEHSNAGSSQAAQRRGSRQKSNHQQHQAGKHQSRSAPRKRVVSDTNWQRMTSNTDSRAQSSKATRNSTPTRESVNEAARLRSHGSRSEARKHSGEKTTVFEKDNSLYEDGIRVYPTPTGSKNASQIGNNSLAYRDTNSSCGNDGIEANIHPESPSRNVSLRGCRSSKAERPSYVASAYKTNDLKHKATRGKERTPDADWPTSDLDSFSNIRVSTKSQKGNILSQVIGGSKKLFSKSEPFTPPRVPNIESWLDDTPDPFVDGGNILSEVPPLFQTKAKQEKTIPPELLIPADPNKIWDTLDVSDPLCKFYTGSRRRRKDRSSADRSHESQEEKRGDFSSADRSHQHREDATQSVAGPDGKEDFYRSAEGVGQSQREELPASPSTLRRRGARKKQSTPKKDTPEVSTSKEQVAREGEPNVNTSAYPVDMVESVKASTLMAPSTFHSRKGFPRLGSQKLSTIASVETFRRESDFDPAKPESQSKDHEHIINHKLENSDEARDKFDSTLPARAGSRGRSIKHSDLLSILSMPQDDIKSIRSSRSIKTNKRGPANATVADVMAEFEADELKYMREIRTMVDGVIPVLLSCVLSKSESATAVGLFKSNGSSRDTDVIKPIVDMGIALERLKSLHKRAPRHDHGLLLTWAQGGTNVYADYLKSWRMGFQDVVVNLAPASKTSTGAVDTEGKDNEVVDEDLLPRNKNGDVVNADGERIDVAFLLKRPLVRLKYICKTIRCLNVLKPSAEGDALAQRYQGLVSVARDRANEERARLEDEAASAIDSTRARDLRTLGPLTGVIIDRTRRVRARDFFGLTLQHSSAQRIDCRVELLIRDDALDGGPGGDVLVCEVDGTGRWLLFPPIHLDNISARNGDLSGELIVMIRGSTEVGVEWHELLSLQSDEQQTGFDWVQMLGLEPIPPTLQRSLSFINRHQRRLTIASSIKATLNDDDAPGLDQVPSPRELEIPLGEQASGDVKHWDGLSSRSTIEDSQVLLSRSRRRLQKRPRTLQSSPGPPSSPLTGNGLDQVSSSSSPKQPSQVLNTDYPLMAGTNYSNLEASSPDMRESNSPGLQRVNARRQSRHAADLNGNLQSTDLHDAQRDSVKSGEGFTRPNRPLDVVSHESALRSSNDQSRASVPSLGLPFIPKLRKDSPPTTPTYEISEEVEWPNALLEKETRNMKTGKKKRPSSSAALDAPNALPVYGDRGPVQLSSSSTPELTSTVTGASKRRSSSPLKHEYDPSSTTDSSSDSDTSTVERHDLTSFSEDFSTEDELEGEDTHTPLVPLGAVRRNSRLSSHGSFYNLPNGTLSPSSSASQAPYKAVPIQRAKAVKMIASILSWSDAGSWKSLFPDECSITVTPGLIEAFEMSAAHSNPDSAQIESNNANDSSSPSGTRTSSQASDPNLPRPLVALELTPLVPIRRGTALDISIRSPPTSDSILTNFGNNNILFRSRSPEECEALYALINHARINNPTYMALQNARLTLDYGSHQFASPFHPVAGPSRRSWFGFGGSSAARSSYRARSTSSPSVAQSATTFTSAFSAFSALRRFQPSARFNIARSTVTSRVGSMAESLTESSGSGTSSPLQANGIGINNTEIDFYVRVHATRWDVVGRAVLTIMRPTLPLMSEGVSTSDGSVRAPRPTDKRIVVVGKGRKIKGETLLDVTLGEACFERIMGRGIAVSVWENGEVGKEGGVVAGRLKVFLLRFNRELETAYTFALVGRPRF